MIIGPRSGDRLVRLIDARIARDRAANSPRFEDGVVEEVGTNVLSAFLGGSESLTPNISYSEQTPRRGDHIQVFRRPDGYLSMTRILERTVVPEQLEYPDSPEKTVDWLLRGKRDVEGEYSIEMGWDAADVPYLELAGKRVIANPMTASGDLVRGGTAGTPTRVPIGPPNTVLTSVNGAPTWRSIALATGTLTITKKGAAGTYRGATTTSPPGARDHNLGITYRPMLLVSVRSGAFSLTGTWPSGRSGQMTARYGMYTEHRGNGVIRVYAEVYVTEAMVGDAIFSYAVLPLPGA